MEWQSWNAVDYYSQQEAGEYVKVGEKDVPNPQYYTIQERIKRIKADIDKTKVRIEKIRKELNALKNKANLTKLYSFAPFAVSPIASMLMGSDTANAFISKVITFIAIVGSIIITIWLIKRLSKEFTLEQRMRIHATKGKAEEIARHQEAVSYTHLTLPTN